MAETANIAKMAEILSQDLFSEFLWQRTGPMNISWPCVDQERHHAKNHPSDIVFHYDEPYSQARTYINVDLKSYAKGTISASNVQSALNSMAKSLSCAEISSFWRDSYIHDHVSPEICGMLFIYNHDGEYDGDFNSLLDKVKIDELDIPKGSRIFVLGPQDVYWLNNVRHEIVNMRGGSGDIPRRELCRFSYPHLVRKKNVQLEHAKAATLETLTAPWIILSFTHENRQNRKGYVVFSRRRGESVDEFLYMIDYLMHFQILVENTDVYIKLLDPDPRAAAFFGKAKTQYVDEVDGGEEIQGLLDAIKYQTINDVRTSFSEIELGME